MKLQAGKYLHVQPVQQNACVEGRILVVLYSKKMICK